MSKPNINSITKEQYSLIINSLEGKPYSGGYMCKCPCHPDKTSSLSVNITDTDRLLLHCHAGCTYEKILSVIKSDIMRIPLKSVVEQIESIYQYTNEQGKPLFEKVKRRMQDGGKKFTLRKKVEGRYVYSGVVKDLTPPLYNLPKVIATQSIILVEGEKDADSLAALDLVATTNFDGAGKWRSHYATPLKDKDVIIMADNDEPGRAHADLVAKNIFKQVRSLKIIHFTELPNKADVSDYLNKHSKDELLARIKATPFFTQENYDQIQQDLVDVSDDSTKGKKAKYEDYVALYKDCLLDIKRDIFSDNAMYYRKANDSWESVWDKIPNIRSLAAIKESKSKVRYNRSLIEDHLYTYIEDLKPELLLELPVWDKVDRIKIFSDCLVPAETQGFSAKHFQELLTDWLVKAWMRIEQPATRNRILILKGKQKIGKDWWIESLLCGAGQFFNPVSIMKGDKDSYLQLSEGIFLLIGEFETTTRTEVGLLKELITLPYTKLRAPYDRGPRKRYSRSSFISGCNIDDILRDYTGSTRYIILEIEKIRFDYPLRSKADGLQVLAQTKYLAENNSLPHPKVEKDLEVYLDTHQPDDPVQAIIEEYEYQIDQMLKNMLPFELQKTLARELITEDRARELLEKICTALHKRPRDITTRLKSMGYAKRTSAARGYQIPRDLLRNYSSSLATESSATESGDEEIPF